MNPVGLIAVDPGKNMGYAVFSESVLVQCGVHRVDAIRDVPRFNTSGRDLVIEIPQHYPGQRGHKADATANDLIGLAYIAGAVAGQGWKGVTEVYPRQWKGTVSKEITKHRLIGTEEKAGVLTPAEIEILCSVPGQTRHNAIDAIGLGAWRLGRLKR